ncbi:phosphoinositide phosphatase-like protein [Lineolata rhizophorae]|uniref:Phosphoinositide phosphatase-like protein n=1 Tax=Lineolata rhizophorae TaxID=578093 RepID=A0A6A6NR79_9PEZI|nr:phosphoinositide phosphatase-like protein [Lineolata rhizophorae]
MTSTTASRLPFRDINVHASPSYYAFSSPSSPSAPALVVERPSGDLRLDHDGKATRGGGLSGVRRVSSIAGILGVVRLRLDRYVIVITKAQPMGRLKGHMVYKVAATELLPLRERPLHDPDEDGYLALLRALLRQAPLYFSYSADLTNSFQRQAAADLSQPLWRRADDRFFWNRFVASDLIDFRDGSSGSGSGGGSMAFRHALGPQPDVDPYILPVMFGMMRIAPTAIKGTPLTFVLITRRSRHRAGTRYLSRGIDERGHVSNFNETEMVVILNDDAQGGLGGFAPGQFQNGKLGGGAGGADGRETQVLSYVQTRGSVPLYWAEVNTLHYTPALQIRGVETAATAARLHFAEQIRLYGDNYLVNLVNQKGRERRVKEAYEQLVRELVSTPAEHTEPDSAGITAEKFHTVEPRGARGARGRGGAGGDEPIAFDRLHYIYFDFHSETKGLRWHRALLLMDQLRDAVASGGYFRGVDMPGGRSSSGRAAAGGEETRLDVRARQRYVVRTNCMDCLDRTNVVQSMLARVVLTRMLHDAGCLRAGEAADDDAAFESLFRNVWADNADVVSRAYSGTGALKTDFTRTGKRTRAGALRDLTNSVTRYVLNNFGDGPRQDAFDLFLGAHVPDDEAAGAAAPPAGLFVDTRPVAIQAVPYVLLASVFFVLVGSLTRRPPDATVWPLRLLMLVFLVVGAICAHFMWTHGTLYVNWPKLNPPPWVQENYLEALSRVRSTPLLGPLVIKHERGRSEARMSYLEEGKKRIE